jgi:hypothetical protein
MICKESLNQEILEIKNKIGRLMLLTNNNKYRSFNSGDPSEKILCVLLDAD